MRLSYDNEKCKFDCYLSSRNHQKDIESCVGRHIRSKQTFVTSTVKLVLVNFRNTSQRQGGAKEA